MDHPTGGIQSLDAALRLLKQLAARGGPVALSELAREAEMPVSKAHRYLASFVAAGLVQQTARSGKYDLGPEALQLGIAAMVRRDYVNLAADRLPDLVAETGQTALLCVWGSFGPTVVRWERSANFIVTSLGLGSTLPLQGSATGRVFLGFAPPQITATVTTAGPATGGGTFFVLGDHFYPGTTLTVGGVAATISGLAVNSILAIAPPGTLGQATVVVTSPTGCTATTTYTYQ